MIGEDSEKINIKLKLAVHLWAHQLPRYLTE